MTGSDCRLSPVTTIYHFGSGEHIAMVAIRTRKKRSARGRSAANWSDQVTRGSNALDLEDGVFTWDDPKRIAMSLKRSADSSTRRKATPFRSAMSMLVFYINRAGRNLDAGRLAILQAAKAELRRLYGRR